MQGNLAGYRVFWRRTGETCDYDRPDWEGAEITCTIYGLDSDMQYYFVVRAYDALGIESGNSNEVCTDALPAGTSCSLPDGHADYCTECGPCVAGEGDCDTDAQCANGLICAQDVGADYGFRSDVDVCELP